MPAVDKITAGLQHLWALTETMRANQTQTSLGRYDVSIITLITLIRYMFLTLADPLSRVCYGLNGKKYIDNMQ